MRVVLVIAALTLASCGSEHVVARTADGDEVASLSLPGSRTFALEYRHSYYRRPARETFRVGADGSFSLIAVSSPSEAVLDYYEIEGERERRGAWWTLRPAGRVRFQTLPLAATEVGRRTLVAGGARAPLYGGPVHMVIGVR